MYVRLLVPCTCIDQDAMCGSEDVRGCIDLLYVPTELYDGISVHNTDMLVTR